MGWDCGYEAIANAIDREGYTHALARKKPPLSNENKAIRFQWAQEHLNWSIEQWNNILWSDETWVNPGRHTRVWITRKKGQEEVYHPDCVEPRYQHKIRWMFWGCISGKYGKGLGIFWEKAWGPITEESYSRHIIIPQLAEYMKEHPGLQFQQGNAGWHAARYTYEQLKQYGIPVIFWPLFSPDLSPIETVWDWIKDWIEEYDPTVHRNYKRLRAAIIQAWESILHDEVRTLIRDTMRERCQAVIDAQGGETKF